ncbi:DNA polymerase [Pseudoduganella lurida]|uniref:Type-4 uracil-DNA glycosylase n=1 Tax=Pseudoduganella lurida TaxID=1036180 RepID=A0A562QXN4_9BURK|nr:UdgX family uracil-DNA binding protein [Pseudoduganella lurida]TWI61601.1 DNA polymerase [Pseudoduganella lurida]
MTEEGNRGIDAGHTDADVPETAAPPIDAVALALSGQPVVVTTFGEWRTAARALIVRRIPPESVQWSGQDGGGDLLSAMPPVVPHSTDNASDPPPPQTLRVSRQLLELLQGAACYRVHDRWAFLYRVLWRWSHGAPDVISPADEDGNRLHHMAKAVRHEEHDMHAYLRFRERPEEAGAPRFVAWFEPAHDVLPQVAQHFSKRMGRTSWMIATPEATVLWDGATLVTGEALAKSAADFDDAGESLWLTYYRSIFNPARLNADIMHSHIRHRFWKNLPEAAVVPHMVSQAAAGARKVGQLDTVGQRRGTTIPIAPGKAIPERQQPTSLDECRRCDLWQDATQAVAGQGARHAKIMLVGEQPGDQEDLAGKPFVGPAGELLDRAMDGAGLDRRKVYVTNAVKHFKWEPRGKRRLHKTPAQKEVMACHYWLETELATVAPQVLVALGSTALKSILQSGSVTMKDYLDAPFQHEGRWVVATYHPAYALRVPDAASRQAAFEAIVEALKTAQRLADGAPPEP